jgi:hypothetical protein
VAFILAIALYAARGRRRIPVMAKHKGDVYIERREEGDYAVRAEHSKRASATAPTQGEAIEIAKKLFPEVRPDVERVRYTNKGKPDQRRKA